jgi:hypothetical protein
MLAGATLAQIIPEFRDAAANILASKADVWFCLVIR